MPPLSQSKLIRRLIEKTLAPYFPLQTDLKNPFRFPSVYPPDISIPDFPPMSIIIISLHPP